MKITLNTVIDTFAKYALINHIPLNENRAYSWAAFLPEDLAELRTDILYIFDINEQDVSMLSGMKYSFLCIAGQGTLNSDIPGDCLAVKGISSVTHLAEMIQKRFTSLIDWDNSLKDIVIKNGSYQDIIDASEYILGNPLQVLDASYKLLATTTHIRSDDEIDIKLTESGFHSQATLRKIQESGRLKAYKEETGIIINQPGNPNKYGTVGRWFWDSGMPVVHTLMICKNGSPSPSLIDIFQVLTEHCRNCFLMDQRRNPQTGRIYDSLINDLLFGSINDPAEINERAKVADIPVTGCFTLCKILLRENNETLIKRVFNDLFQFLPNARIILHQFEIIVLNSYDKDDVMGQIKRDSDKIYPLLNSYDAVCGTSSPFNRIIDMPVAFSQAAKAISMGESVKESKLLHNTDADQLFAPLGTRNVFYYDDILIYHLISLGMHNDPNVFKNSICWDIVRNMWKDDERTDNDNARILFTYLMTERKATRTGELLHMHRNNVIYRINKIEEMTGLDLDDYWTRMKLLISFHLLRLELTAGNEE